MKRTNTLCALLLAVMLMPGVVMAQACPHTYTHNVRYNSAYVIGADSIFFSHSGSGVECSATPVGAVTFAPISCGFLQLAPGPLFAFINFNYANWLNPTARNMAATMSPDAGCKFYCGVLPTTGASPMRPNTCMVKAADGLPVELMEFSVGE